MRALVFFLVSFSVVAFPATAERAKRPDPIFAIGFDFLTRQDAIDAYTTNLVYEQDDSGLTFSVELPLASGDGLVFEYRDAGEATITCTDGNGYVDIDAVRYYCLQSGVSGSEASSISAAYKYYTSSVAWKLGLGFSFIEYESAYIPNREETGLYVGWSVPVSRNENGAGLNLDFGSVLGNTFGIGLQYQFGN